MKIAWRSVGRWWVVGLGFHVFGLTLLWAVTSVAGLPLSAGTVVTAEVTLLLRFLVNDRWVFGNARPTWKRLWQFHVASALGAAIWFTVTNSLARFGVHYLIGSNVGTACSVVVSMASNFLWVWKGRDHPAHQKEPAAAQVSAAAGEENGGTSG